MPKFFQPENPPHHQEEVSEEHFSPKISEAGEVKTILSWEAPARPFRPKDKSFYITVAILVTLLMLIAFLFQEFLLMGVILALAFVSYVLAFVPPNDIRYKISTQGVTIGDHFYFWHELASFWFKEKEAHKVLFIQTYLRFPGQLMLVLGDQSQEEVQKQVAKFLPFHEIPKTTVFDKWTESLQKHFPLENTHR